MRSLYLWLALLASLVYSLSFAASTPAPVTTFRNYSTLQQLGAGPENTLLYKGRQIVAGSGGGSATVQNLTFQAGNNMTIVGDDAAKSVTFNAVIPQAASQSDSTALDFAGLKADFNALLAKLRAAGIMQ